MKSEDIIQETNKLYLENEKKERATMYAQFADGKTFCLYGLETQEKFLSLIDELYNSDIKIKDKITNSKFIELVEYLLAHSNLSKESIKETTDKINEVKKYLFIVPISGINDDYLDIIEIDNVLFFKADKIKEIADSKDYFVYDFAINELDVNKIFLGIKIVAYNEELAKIKFDNQLDDIFNIVKFTICEDDPNALISYEIDPIKKVKKYFIGNESCGETTEFINDTYYIDKNLKEIYKNGSIGKKLLEIAQKNIRNKIEEDILDSITLYLYSIKNIKRKGFSVALLASAIETLLLPNNRLGNLSESVSLILATLCGKNVDERLNIIDMYKDFYKVRSANVHSGKNSESKVDIFEMYKLYIKAIGTICINEPYSSCCNKNEIRNEALKKLLEF